MVEYEVLTDREKWNYAQIGDFFQKSWFPQEKASNGSMDFDAKDIEKIFVAFPQR